MAPKRINRRSPQRNVQTCDTDIPTACEDQIEFERAVNSGCCVVKAGVRQCLVMNAERIAWAVRRLESLPQWGFKIFLSYLRIVGNITLHFRSIAYPNS
jgi:hypothetical protein